MPSTPNYAIPYPSVTDAPDGPAQMGALALQVDAQLSIIVNDIAASIATLANPPRAQMRQIVAQGITTATWTSLTFTAEDLDSHNGHDNVTNNTRYTSQVSGVYLLDGGVWYEANATGVRLCRWAKNGTVLVGSGVEAVPVTGGQTALAAKGYLVSLNVGDYVELQAWHNRGSTLNTYVGGGGDEAQSSMTVTLVRNNNF